MKNKRDKEIRDLIENLISKTNYKDVNKIYNENDYTEGLGIFVNCCGDMPHDPLHEEVWEGDVDIKLYSRDVFRPQTDDYIKSYDLTVNEDKLTNYKYGEYLYKLLKNKYARKKKDNKIEKISRIIQRLEKTENGTSVRNN